MQLVYWRGDRAACLPAWHCGNDVQGRGRRVVSLRVRHGCAPALARGRLARARPHQGRTFRLCRWIDLRVSAPRPRRSSAVAGRSGLAGRRWACPDRLRHRAARLVDRDPGPFLSVPHRGAASTSGRDRGSLPHPSYSGILLVLAGIALATGDVLSLAAVAVLGGTGLTVRIRAEERQLTEAQGAQYERFAAQRKRLVPGVW